MCKYTGSGIGHCENLELAKQLSSDIAEHHLARRLLEVQLRDAK